GQSLEAPRAVRPALQVCGQPRGWPHRAGFAIISEKPPDLAIDRRFCQRPGSVRRQVRGRNVGELREDRRSLQGWDVVVELKSEWLGFPHASNLSTRFPCTSVSRKSRPWNR